MKSRIGDSDLINVRFGPLCGLKSDISRGLRSANSGCEQMHQHAVHGRSSYPRRRDVRLLRQSLLRSPSLRRPYGFIPFYLLFERVVFAKPVSTFAGDAS